VVKENIFKGNASEKELESNTKKYKANKKGSRWEPFLLYNRIKLKILKRG